LVSGADGLFSWHPNRDEYSDAAALIEERVTELRSFASSEIMAEADSVEEEEVRGCRAWIQGLEQTTWNSIVELYFLPNDVRQDLLRIQLAKGEAKLGFKGADR
jgi:hypothetical protein